jgi:hypothetical protein
MARRSAWVLLACLLLALVNTHPLWLHLADAVPSDIGDPLLNAWVLAWDAHALLTDPLHLFDANLFYPLPNTLAYSEHLLAVAGLALPWQVLTGQPLVAYNWSLLISFGLAGLGMYLLVLRWTRRAGAAWLAGLAFAFAPYRLAAIAHLQLLSAQWLPFSLLALDWLLDGYAARGTGRWKPAALLAIFTVLQMLTSWYLAVFTLLVLAVYGLAWLAAQMYPSAGTRRERNIVAGRLVRLAVAGLAVGALVAPVAWPYVGALPQLQAGRPVQQAEALAAQPTDFLAAAPFLRIFGPLTQPLRQRPGFTEENVLWLGWLTPLLALAGLILPWVPGRQRGSLPSQRWRSAAMAAVAAGALLLTTAGPYASLVQLIPMLQALRVPPRWVIPASFAMAALAGYGIAWLSRHGQPRVAGQVPLSAPPRPSPTRSRYLTAGLTGLLSVWLVAESFAVPLPLAMVGAVRDWPPVYRALARLVAREAVAPAVIELPMYVAPAAEYPETKRMIASSLGWWKLVNGYSGLTPARQPALAASLAGFPSATALTTLVELGSRGVRYLMVHSQEAPLNAPAWETQLRWQVERQTYMMPVGQFGGDYLYVINPYGDQLATHPELAAGPFWSTYRPLPVETWFGASRLDAAIQLLAVGLHPDVSDVGEIEETSAPPGRTRVILYWQATRRLPADYTVFVHSLDADGKITGQADSPPLANHYPTGAWQPGEVVQDNHVTPAGQRYRLGLYDPATNQRLQAFAADGRRLPDDAVILQPGID